MKRAISAISAICVVAAPALAIPPSLDVPEPRTFHDRSGRQESNSVEAPFVFKGEIETKKSNLAVCSEGAAYAEDLDDALKACDAAIVESPDNGDVRYYRGFVLFHLERYADAEADFSEAIKLGATRSAESYYQRGVCKERQHRLRAAAADFKKANELKPDWAAARRKVDEYQWAYKASGSGKN